MLSSYTSFHSSERELAANAALMNAIKLHFLFIKWDPFTPAILYQGNPILIPHNHTIERINQSSPGTGNFIIDSILTQAPRRVNAPVGAAHGPLIVQVQAGSNLLVRHPLSHQLGHAQLVWFQ